MCALGSVMLGGGWKGGDNFGHSADSHIWGPRGGLRPRTAEVWEGGQALLVMRKVPLARTPGLPSLSGGDLQPRGAPLVVGGGSGSGIWFLRSLWVLAVV